MRRRARDEARLPGARMGHRHLVEPTEAGGSRRVYTIYIEGAPAPLWRRDPCPALNGPSLSWLVLPESIRRIDVGAAGIRRGGARRRR